MPGIRDGGIWKEFNSIYVKESGLWKETAQVWQKNAGSWRLIWEPSTASFQIGTDLINDLSDGPFSVSGFGTVTFKALGNFQAEVVMWGSGASSSGGYSYGTVNFLKDYYYLIVVGFGGGSGGNGYGGPVGGNGGGYAGLFEGSTSGVSGAQTQALLIAGGSGGASGFGITGGGGGGSTGINGNIGTGGGLGRYGSRSFGGSGGSAIPSGYSNYSPSSSGAPGDALSGGYGGNGGASYQSAEPFGPGFIYYVGSDGAGGGGGGYYGGGGGGGGSAFVGPPDYLYGTQIYTSGSGGGGCGYINQSKVLNPYGTSVFSGSSDPDRGTAGNSSGGYGSADNAKVVIRLPT